VPQLLHNFPDHFKLFKMTLGLATTCGISHAKYIRLCLWWTCIRTANGHTFQPWNYVL